MVWGAAGSRGTLWAAATIVIVVGGADAQCRTEVGDCWGVAEGDCAASFDRHDGYRMCAMIDGSCDGEEISTASPSFDVCPGGEDSPVSEPSPDSGTDGAGSPRLPDTLCDPAPPQESCTEFDIDGDGVKEAFPAWISEPFTVTVPSGASVGDSMDLTLASGQVLSITIPDIDLSAATFEYPLLTQDCLVFCEDDAKKAECCASFFSGSYVEDNPADPWGRWASDLGSERIYQYMRPLPGIQSSAGSATATCKGHSCSRAWYWAGLFEPPSAGETTYTLTFRKGEVIGSWYGYSSRLNSVKLALVPMSDGGTFEDTFGADATRFWGPFDGPRAPSTNDCRLSEYPVLDCGSSAGYTPGTVEDPSTTCPEGCRLTQAVGDEPETCTSQHFPSNGVCDVPTNMCWSLTDCEDCAGMTIDGVLQDCFEPCELRGLAVVHGEEIAASECKPYEIEFDYDRDSTEITVAVPGTGRFALFVKDQRWTAHLQNSDECEDGSACHYVSVGDTPIWPSSSTFADSCSESVQLEDGTWQTGTCPDGSCVLGGQCGGTPRKCAGNGAWGTGGTPDDDIVCPDPSIRIGCYVDGKPVPFNGASCGGVNGGHTEECCMVAGRCAGNTDGDQDVKCPASTRLKKDKCVAINPAWDTGQTQSYLRGLPTGSIPAAPAEYERICAAVALTGDPKTFANTCEDIGYENEVGSWVGGICGHAHGQYWLRTGAHNGLYVDQKQDVGYCCELDDPGALPGYSRPTSAMGFGEQLQIYRDNVRNVEGALDNPYKIGMIMLQWADMDALDLPSKEVVRTELFEGPNRDYMQTISGGKFSFEPVFYGENGWIPIDTPEISTTPITAPWGAEEPKCFQKVPLDICIAEHAIKCRDAAAADCLGDDPETACLIAGAPVETGASTSSGMGYVGDPIAWFNSHYVDGDSGNGLIDAANDPVALSACQYIPGDGTKGSSSCVAKATATCEAFETTASRYNREDDDSNPENLADPVATCENLGPCVYHQAPFPSYGNYKALNGVTEAECLADTAHQTNRFGHKQCHFNMNWRNVFSECNDGELYGYRPYCYECVVTAPEVPGCLHPTHLSEDECDADIRCENSFLRTTFDNSAAESRLGESTLPSGEVLNSVDGWEQSDGIPASPVADDWLTWAAGVDRTAECEAFDDDDDGTPDGVYGITKCAELAPMVGEGPWLQDNLAIPGFDPTAIDGLVIIAPAPRCGQHANAGVRTLKVFNVETNEHEIYKFPGLVMSFNAPSEASSCSEPNYDPFCSGGSVTFIHELIHQLGVGFHAYGPGLYEDGDCTPEFRDCPFADYGNIMSIMGPSSGPGKELDAHLRYYLFWLNLDDVVVIRRDGQYTINPIADPSALKRAAQILLTSGEPPEGYSHPNQWGQFWLEYRRPIGFDIGLGADDFVTNTQGLIIAAGSTVIDATTGQPGDWKQISFNTQWEDPYSSLAITIDSMDDDSITFTVSGMCQTSSCPDDENDDAPSEPSSPPPPPRSSPTPEANSDAPISMSLTLDVEYSRTWAFQFTEIGYPAGSMAEATSIFNDVCVDDKTDSVGRHAPSGGKYTSDFFAADVAASISSLLDITPGISCTPSVHGGTHRSCTTDRSRVQVTTVQPGAAARTTLVSFDVLANPLTGEQIEPSAVASALVDPNLVIAGHNTLGNDCIGSWSTCGTDCGDKTYTVLRAASGSGHSCTAADGDTMSCSAGEGSCLANAADIDCIGSWSTCTASCADKEFTVTTPQSGLGDPCVADAGATLQCSAGEGDCQARAETPTSEAPPENSVAVQLTLDIPMPADEELDAFKSTFKTDIATTLDGVTSDDVVITNVAPGSVIVDFYIAPAADGTALVSIEAVSEALVADITIAGAILTAESVSSAPTVSTTTLTPTSPEVPYEDGDLNATGIPYKTSGTPTASSMIALFGCATLMLLHTSY